MASVRNLSPYYRGIRQSNTPSRYITLDEVSKSIGRLKPLEDTAWFFPPTWPFPPSPPAMPCSASRWRLPPGDGKPKFVKVCHPPQVDELHCHQNWMQITHDLKLEKKNMRKHNSFPLVWKTTYNLNSYFPTDSPVVGVSEDSPPTHLEMAQEISCKTQERYSTD